MQRESETEDKREIKERERERNRDRYIIVKKHGIRLIMYGKTEKITTDSQTDRQKDRATR